MKSGIVTNILPQRVTNFLTYLLSFLTVLAEIWFRVSPYNAKGELRVSRKVMQWKTYFT